MPLCQLLPAFVASIFGTTFRHVCRITAIYFTLLVHPNRRASTVHRSYQDPTTGLTRHVLRRPQVNFHFNLKGHTNPCHQNFNGNARLRNRHTSRHSKVNPLFRDYARRSSNFYNFTFRNLIYRNGANSLQVNNRVLISAIRTRQVVIGIRARLLTRNNRFTNFTTRCKCRLLYNRQFSSAAAFLRFSRRRVRLYVQFLRVQRILFTDTNFRRLISSFTPFSTTLILTSRRTKTIQVLNNLLNMHRRDFNRLIINVLRISRFSRNGIKGRQ